MNFWDELMGDDEHAATYMETYGEGVGAPTRHKLSELIDENESVLDVGCGPGWNLDHFLKFGLRLRAYRGLDYSERFVRVANERWQNGQTVVSVPPENTEYWTYPIFRLGDCRSLEESDESFDVVILQDCLEHTNGYEKPMQEALRVARKRAVVVFWHLTENDDHINDDGNDGWGAWYSRPKWEEFLNTLGYKWEHSQLEYPAGRTRDYYVISKGSA